MFILYTTLNRQCTVPHKFYYRKLLKYFHKYTFPSFLHMHSKSNHSQTCSCGLKPIKRYARTYFVIKIVNCTICSWFRKLRSLEDNINGYIQMSNCFPSFIVRWIFNFVENWYPTNKSDFTVLPFASNFFNFTFYWTE